MLLGFLISAARANDPSYEQAMDDQNPYDSEFDEYPHPASTFEIAMF
jgi:hypothetical protein